MAAHHSRASANIQSEEDPSDTMSYVYDPTTGTSQWVPIMPFVNYTHDPSHGVYGIAYAPTEDYEVSRRQNAYEHQYISGQLRELEAQRQREQMRYNNNDHPPAAIGSHHQNGNTPQHFPARADAHLGLPTRNEQRYPVPSEQHNKELNTTDSQSYSRRGNLVSSPDDDVLLSREDAIARRYAEIGPAAYIESIVIRDSLRDPRLSRPIFRTVQVPSFADDTLLAERVGALGPAAYMERVFAQDDLHPLSWHPLPEGPAPPLEGVDSSQDTLSRRLIRALDEYYRRGLKEEPGHRFDNMDDTVIAAYINAQGCVSRPGQGILRIVGHEQPFSVFDSWVLRISFLHLQQSALEVLLPIDRDAITVVDNDILRVLYVHLSNGSRTIPRSVTSANVEESRRRVLSELERRGFTKQMPRFARLFGLSDPSAEIIIRDTASSSRLTENSNASVSQSSREVKTPAASVTRDSKDRRDNKARQRVRRGSVSTTTDSSGEVTEKRKGKAPVTRKYETDSDHSSAASSSNTVRYELDISSSEVSIPSAGDEATPAETTSWEDSDYNSENTKRKAGGIRSRRRGGLWDQKSDH